MSPKRATRRGKRTRGCESCRTRHLRCDAQDPCAQCSISGRNCIRASSTRFQHSSISSRSKRALFAFGSDQTWCSSSGDLSFIEETSTLKLEYGEKGPENADTAQLSTGSEDVSSQDGADATNADESPAAANTDISRLPKFPDPEAHQANEQTFLSTGILNHWDDYAVNGPESWTLPMLSCQPTEETLFPVASRRLAYALMNFQSNVAPTLDLGAEPGLSDSLLFLGSKDCSLMNAILGICDGQPHPNSTRSFDQGTAFTPSKVVEPGGAESTWAGSFASFKSRISHSDSGITESPENIDSTYLPTLFDINDPAFWFRLQQNIFTSVIEQEPLTLQAAQTFEQKHNPHLAWSRRLQMHLADVVNFCFGPNGNDGTSFDDLVSFTHEWVESGRYGYSASTFGYVDDEAVFPEIYVVGDDLLMELQIYHLLRILLSAHDPGLPRIGRRKKESMRMIDAQMVDDLMIVCGLAGPTKQITQAHVMACLAISLAGDRLIDSRRRDAVMQILQRTMQTAMWNTASVQQHLREEWEWD